MHKSLDFHQKANLAYDKIDIHSKEFEHMENKLPFYMTYPMPFLYDDERLNRRDSDYMKSIYPDTAKRLVPYIEEECDRMEYDASMMYDEYPDRLQLRLMCRRIYDRAKDGEKEPGSWLQDLIEVMAYQELCRRRQEQRSIQRKFF